MNRERLMIAAMVALAVSSMRMPEPKAEQPERIRQQKLTNAEKKRAKRGARNIAIQNKDAQP